MRDTGPVIYLDSEALRQEAVGIGEGGGDDVRESSCNMGGEGVTGRCFSDFKETTGGKGGGAFKVSPPLLAIPAAVAFFPFFPPRGRSEPAAST